MKISPSWYWIWMIRVNITFNRLTFEKNDLISSRVIRISRFSVLRNHVQIGNPWKKDVVCSDFSTGWFFCGKNEWKRDDWSKKSKDFASSLNKTVFQTWWRPILREVVMVIFLRYDNLFIQNQNHWLRYEIITRYFLYDYFMKLLLRNYYE